MPRWAAVAALPLLGACTAQAGALEVSGYYKNLAIASETLAPAGRGYGLDRNRVRLELKGALAENVSVDLQYDNEVLAGSYLRTEQFALQAAQRPDTFWNLERGYGEGGAWYGRHRLYRSIVTVAIRDTDVRLGRQRVAWGTGRFWSPLDLLNPVDPIALEREERTGVDAVLVEHRFGPVDKLSAVYAPSRDRVPSVALRWHSNSAGVDYSIVVARLRGERVLGADIATQLGGAGLRAEIAHHVRDDARTFVRSVLGLDYAFANTLSISGELHYNGAGATERAHYDFSALFTGRVQSLARRYAGASLSYEFTPLLKSVNTAVVNLDDHSRYLSPTLVCSLRADLDLTLGVQIFRGAPGSEYRALRDVYFAQLQWFF